VVCGLCGWLSGGLHVGGRLAAVDGMQLALWARHSSAGAPHRQGGVERRPTVREHRPEGHLLRDAVQVRARPRSRPDARYVPPCRSSSTAFPTRHFYGRRASSVASPVVCFQRFDAVGWASGRASGL